jgi:predicted Zn-dependent protease
MIDVIGVLKNQELFAAEQARRDGRQPRTYHGTFDTHPSNDARLKQVVGEAYQYTVANPREGRSDYLQKMAGVVFGDSPEQGVIRGNALLHEKLGLAIQFPQGWRIQNRPDRVVAISPKADALVELQQGPKSAKPLDTLQKGLKLDAGARYDSGKLSGYPAAFAAGAQNGKPVVVAAVVFNGTQYLIAGMAKDKPAYERERSTLRAAINSFRAITPAERQAARPYRLRLETAQAGTTMAALARQSPLGADAESQLRLMNGLYPGGEPKPGQLLKIVQ